MLPRGRDGIKWLLGLIVRRPESIQRDADDEVDSVLDGRVEFLVSRGITPEAARTEAVRRLGGSVDAARQSVRRSAERRERVMSIREWLEGLASDVRYGVRGLRREPLFSGFAVLTLALGIGANAAMFGIVDKLLLRGPAHVRDAKHVVRLFWRMRYFGGNEATAAAFDPHVYVNLQAEARAFAGLAMYTATFEDAVLGTANDARLIAEATATSTLMSVLGAQPEVGRFFTIDEQQSQTPARVAVLGYALWQSDFGADRAIVGRSVTINSRPYLIVGVAPKGFTGVELDRVDVWFPLATQSGPAARHWPRGLHSSGPAIVARLKPRVTQVQATADATNAYRRTYDGDERQYADASIAVGPLHYGWNGAESSAASIARWLLGVSAVVLLLACTNIVNLLLARAVRRRREIAVRIALGAGRARVLRLLLASSLFLALVGSAAGVGVALAIGGLVRRVLLPQVDWTSGLVDQRILAFSLAAALVSGLAIGLLPALRAGRSDIAAVLKAGVREGGGSRSFVRSALMVTQSALAMLLLVGAGLFVHSLDRVRQLDLGVQPERVVWLRPRWPRISDHATSDERARDERRHEDFSREALERIRAAPMVERAAASVGRPFGISMSVTLRLPGRDSLPHLGGFGDPDISAVSNDYFATMGTRLLRGRVFTSTDRAGSELVAIVSATMAKVLWPDQDALGQCLLIAQAKDACSRVVGVAQDARRGAIREDPSMHYYVPLGQQPFMTGPELVVRPRGDAVDAIPALRSMLRQIDPSITFVYAGTLQDRVEPQTRSWRIGAMMFSLFAAVALVVAAVGMFSVVAYLVEQRRHEIGVRVALGAQSAHVVGLMLRGGASATLIGLALGSLLAVAGGRFVEPLLFETNAHDPLLIGGLAVVLLVVSLVASVVPALRARRIDPIGALRDE